MSRLGFLDLPPEIRSRIYKLIFVHESVLPIPSRLETIRSISKLYILGTCRTIYRETRALGFSSVIFRLMGPTSDSPAMSGISVENYREVLMKYADSLALGITRITSSGAAESVSHLTISGLAYEALFGVQKTFGNWIDHYHSYTNDLAPTLDFFRQHPLPSVTHVVISGIETRMPVAVVHVAANFPRIKAVGAIYQGLRVNELYGTIARVIAAKGKDASRVREIRQESDKGRCYLSIVGAEKSSADHHRETRGGENVPNRDSPTRSVFLFAGDEDWIKDNMWEEYG